MRGNTDFNVECTLKGLAEAGKGSRGKSRNLGMSVNVQHTMHANCVSDSIYLTVSVWFLF